MFIEYNKIVISSEDTIQKLSGVLSKLEVKSINKLVNEIELSKVLENHLSNKELDVYYNTKYKLKRLLNK